MTKSVYTKNFFIAIIITLLGFFPLLETQFHKCTPVINPGGPNSPNCYTMPLSLITLPGLIIALFYQGNLSAITSFQEFVFNFLWFGFTLMTYWVLLVLIYKIRKRGKKMKV